MIDGFSFTLPLTRTTARFSAYRWLSFAHKLPVQAWHGDHADSAQGADKAEGRVSSAGSEKFALLQRPYLPRGSDATRWAVTASRSDGPTTTPNNTGKRNIQFCAAYMMMVALS